MEKLTGKIPEIRFPEFKGEWEHKRLSELLSESKKLNTDLKYDKGEVLSVSGELGIVNQIEHLGRSYAGESVHNYGVVETGDIVYTKSPLKANPFGIIKLNKGKAGIVSTLYAVYKVKEKNAVGEFLDYYFSLDANTNRYLRPLVKKGAKNDMKINNAYVLHDRIFAPTIPEQKRIAAFFDVLEKRITQLKKKKDLLEQYKKGVMQKIFSQEIRFKDENGRDFPDWSLVEFEELYCYKTTNSLSRENLNYSIGKIKNIHYGDIHTKYKSQFHLASEYVPFINPEVDLTGLNEDVYCKVGDLIIADASEDYKDIGKCIEISSIGNEKILAGLHTILARPNQNKVQIGYGGYAMQDQNIRLQIQRIAQGTKVLGLSSKMLSKVKVNLPSKLEQTKIANLLSAIDQKISHCQQQIEQTTQWKKGLLQKMFCA
ncbi:MAG: restriction endonuclease subunit S [Bacteroidales bacterium]|nr:restriction endonuclease subunit S [Bacteroidales bacterium]MBN2749430.1 restriction endonuclease subunit S [Bacteroidales bacterium]